MLGTIAIVVGYAALIWQFGWLGVAAGAIHVAVLLLSMPRR